MGISGLLPVLKSITETKAIDQYAGQTIAIDGYCWLHRAIYSCSQEICLGQETDKYITYFMERIQTLVDHDVTPYVVFDGGYLPMKKGTEQERRQQRTKYKELGKKYLAERKLQEARKCFIRAADVTPYMASRIIQRLLQKKISYVVAPYEADAQLAFLIKNKIVDAVISEDSDCLPYGCQRVLFKMDRDGIAQEIDLYTKFKSNQELKFHLFDHQMFLEMCILSGCDYINSLPGLGLKRAYHLMKQYGNYQKIIQALKMEAKIKIPFNYQQDFQKAIQTFQHQRVYDPNSKEIVPLTPLPKELAKENTDFLGPEISKQDAIDIAEGRMDPISRTYFSQLKVTPTTSISDMISKTTATVTAEKTKVSISRFFSHTTKTPDKTTTNSSQDNANFGTPISSQRIEQVTTSFSPVDQDLKHQHHQQAVVSKPKQQQDAFSRMMQASGTLLQKQKTLKRKTFGSQSHLLSLYHKRKTMKATSNISTTSSSTSGLTCMSFKSTVKKNQENHDQHEEEVSEPEPVFVPVFDKENVSNVHTNVSINRNTTSSSMITSESNHNTCPSSSSSSSSSMNTTTTGASLFGRFKYQKSINK